MASAIRCRGNEAHCCLADACGGRCHPCRRTWRRGKYDLSYSNGVPTAQNLTENYEAGLQAVTDLARQEHPNEPAAQQRHRRHFIQQTGQAIHAEGETNRANWDTINSALNGPNAIKSEQDLLTNPRLIDVFP
ncbi:MAG: hypothetical protein ACLQVJ_15280 [Syntrophobacteraceae bacterium]